MACVRDIPYSGGRTNTAEAIEKAGAELVAKSSDDRIRIIEVVTDGKSQIRDHDEVTPVRTQKVATEMKDLGMFVRAIGVGEADKTELGGIASDPEDKWCTMLSNFTALDTIAAESLLLECAEDVKSTQSAERRLLSSDKLQDSNYLPLAGAAGLLLAMGLAYSRSKRQVAVSAAMPRVPREMSSLMVEPQLTREVSAVSAVSLRGVKVGVSRLQSDWE